MNHDASKYYHLDTEFHLALASLYGNVEIICALERLRDKMYRLSTRLHAGYPERLKQNFEEHQEIFESIRAGDGERAQMKLQNHLYRARDLVLNPNIRRRSSR